MRECGAITLPLLLFLVHPLQAVLFENQPRLQVADGHLLIVGAENRNVSIKTSGLGCINVNGVDLGALFAGKLPKQQPAEGATAASAGGEALLSGLAGLADRLAALEKRLGNKTNAAVVPAAATGAPKRMIVTLRNELLRNNRRLLRAETRLNRLYILLERNECANSPCRNGARCQDVFNGFLCQCDAAWQGQLCDDDVNECSRFAGTDLGCQNGATCVNTPGGYYCTCAPGWHGLHCTRKKAECGAGGGAELCGHGTCVPQDNAAGYACLCDQGWRKAEGGGQACTVDVDECKESRPACSTDPLVVCVNTQGGFTCGPCPQGYIGNGFYCSDIDECQLDNGGCSTEPMVQCINTRGSRRCAPCPAGYVGDGTACTFRAPCSANNGGCHPLATCIYSDGSQTCVCPTGYYGDGVGPQGCQTGGPCASNPCPRGTCLPAGSSFRCSCPPGTTGPLCNQTVNLCAPNPCRNNGTCVPQAGSFRCVCTGQFQGPLCTQQKEACGGVYAVDQGAAAYPPQGVRVYSNNVACVWVLKTTSPDAVLNITFSRFHLEEPSDEEGCIHDFLQVHDGKNSASAKIGRFCGTDLPAGTSFVTTRNVAYLWFRSDGAKGYGGFAFAWAAVAPQCGGVMRSNGLLSSPGFPDEYPPNRKCRWSLIAPSGRRWRISFLSDINFGSGADCQQASLTVRSSLEEEGPLLERVCNSTKRPAAIYTPGRVASVVFQSGSGRPGRAANGFQASYESEPGCGGVRTAPAGRIEMSGSDVCDYLIRAPQGTRVRLYFEAMQLGSASLGCTASSVQVREGADEDAPLVGRFCGDAVPSAAPHLSEGPVLSVHYEGGAGTLVKLRYELACGATYAGDSGTISIPGGQLRCHYDIRLRPGMAVALSVPDGDECSDDKYLELRDGPDGESPLLGRFCGQDQDKTRPILASHNYMWVEARGLNATSLNYSGTPVECGGVFREDHGTLRAPMTAGRYRTNANCTYIVLAPPGHVVHLSWTLFRLEAGYKCGFDNVVVFDGASEVGRYCGSRLPPAFSTTSRRLTIRFRSDATQGYEGFLANYYFKNETQVCGSTFMTPTGALKSPNYPDNYSMGLNCAWVIAVPARQRVRLNFTDFELEAQNTCRYDRLEVRLGGQATSPLHGRYCGTTIPRLIVSHTNQIYLRLVTDYSRSAKGFMVQWDSEVTGCGGSLSSTEGIIVSPNYPEAYAAAQMCVWKVATSPGSVLRLMVVDVDLEAHPTCRADYVEIFDGAVVGANSLGRYCSSDQKPIMVSRSNIITVQFRSDMDREGTGFKLRYVTECNVTLTGFGGAVESPPYGRERLSRSNCFWNITVPPGNKINITFARFNLSPSVGGCFFGFIEMLQLPSREVLLNKTCGTRLPPHITSTSNTVQVHFQGMHGFGSGFQAFRLEWALDGCGGHLRGNAGTLQTPGYPGRHPNSLECQWVIEVDGGHGVELRVLDIDMETGFVGGCNYDKLEVFNGRTALDNLLSTLCQPMQNMPIVLTSTGNAMFVRFKADSSHSGRGFRASYGRVPVDCGGNFTAPSGSIQTRNYPKNFKARDACTWYIQVAPSHRINLTFVSFDVGMRRTCNYSAVRVYDGNDPAESPQLLAHCGNTLPSPASVVSTGNVLVVTMATTFSSQGFLASYETACGAVVNVTSPGMLVWRQGEECAWVLQAPQPGQRVSLTFTAIDSEPLSCDNFNITVREGGDSSGPVLETVCGGGARPAIVSAGQALYVSTTEYAPYFTAAYSAFEDSCGAELAADTGAFTTPDYPANYPPGRECQWLLRVARGNGITLNFEELDVVQSDGCEIDYVEVREVGPDGKLRGVFCGSKVPVAITANSSLWVKMKSASTTATGKGFKASYAISHGMEITSDAGRIESPFYPKRLQSWGVYRWRIEATFRNIILLTIAELDMDTPLGGNCQTYLELFDGYDELAPSLGRFCEPPPPDQLTVASTTNVLFVSFTSTSARIGARFAVEWTSAKKELAPDAAASTDTACGQASVTRLAGSRARANISSPGYPAGYRENLNCNWTFATQPDRRLRATFVHINLQSYDSAVCYSDRVATLVSRDGARWAEERTLCRSVEGMGAALVDTMARYLRINFFTDSYGNRTGFLAVVEAVCGGEMGGARGNISMAAGDEAAGGCHWNITVRSGRTVRITVLRINIEKENKDTCSNYLTIKNGGSNESPPLGEGRICGRQPPAALETLGNRAHVAYYTTSPQTDSFLLLYEEVSPACGGSIALSADQPTANVSSPNYPDVPLPHSECTWLVTAPPADRIQVEFAERFDVTPSPECRLAGVEVRDGATASARPLGVFCSDEAPGTVTSSGNVLSVRFYTGADDPKDGFAAVVRLARCGGTVRAMEGKIESPDAGSPQLYQPDLDCEWRIFAPVGYYLRFNFSMLRLPLGRDNCSTVDHVSLYEVAVAVAPSNRTEALLGEWCGVQVPPPTTTAGNAAVLRFKTDSKVKYYRGFAVDFSSVEQVCGDTLKGSTGTFTASVAAHRQCTWTIQVPAGRRVSLMLTEMDETHQWWKRDYLTFKDSIDAPDVRVMNGSRGPYKSSSSQMVVSLWTSSNPSHRGFTARYTSDEPSLCAGALDAGAGTLQSPPSNVSGEMWRCEWPDVGHQPGTTLAITLDQLEFPDAPKCLQDPDSSSVRVLGSGGSLILGAVCSGRAEGEVVVLSPFPDTLLVGQRTRDGSPATFRARYQRSECGGELGPTQDNVEAPQRLLGRTVDCAWVVRSTQGQVELSFPAFDLGSSCQDDYLVVRNGPGPLSPTIGRYCGDNKPPPKLLSASGSIWVELHLAAGQGATAIRMEKRIATQGCGGIFHDVGLELRSPGAGQYPPNAECEWILSAEPGYHVGLSFHGRFQLQESSACSKDYVEAFDRSPSGEWRSLGRRCGREAGPPINSTGTQMRVVFRSDAAVQGDGFNATWQQNCGGVFEVGSQVGRIASPSNGREPLVCNYTLRGPSGRHFWLQFDAFGLEDRGAGCRYDNVTLSGQPFVYTYTEGHDIRGIYCAFNPPTGQELFETQATVTLRTDPDSHNAGFSMSYSLTDCGGNISQPTVLTVSKRLEQDLRCDWTISAPADKIVVLRLLELKMDFSTGCERNYATAYDGAPSNTTLLATMCGSVPSDRSAPVLHSTGPRMDIALSVGTYFTLSKFRMAVDFSTRCGGVVVLEDATSTVAITSPPGPAGEYGPDLDCKWSLFAPEGYVLELEPQQVHVEPCNGTAAGSCDCDYIEVRDGVGLEALPVARLCGHAPRPKMVTAQGNATLRFVTDSTGASHGFRIQVKPVQTACGGRFLEADTEAKNLTSPGFPAPYPAGMRCTWIIRTNTTERINLHITQLDLPQASEGVECTSDVLIVTEAKEFGEDDEWSRATRFNILEYNQRQAALNHRFCGSLRPFEYYSMGRDLVVTFDATNPSSSVAHKGFSLEYHLAKCSRHYTAASGRISVDSFKDGCELTIETPENTTVSVFFARFWLSMSDNCTKARLDVFDGNNEKPVLSVCGYSIPEPVFSSGNRLRLKGHADTYAAGSMDLSYTSSREGRGCGGDLYDAEGRFTSPLYPDSYRAAKTCIWNVTVPAGNQVAFNFKVFDLGTKATCATDHVTLEDLSTKGNAPVTYCGGDRPAIFRTVGNAMRVTYTSSLNNQGLGWVAQFIARLPGELID